jgi:hypothetical protein
VKPSAYKCAFLQPPLQISFARLWFPRDFDFCNKVNPYLFSLFLIPFSSKHASFVCIIGSDVAALYFILCYFFYRNHQSLGGCFFSPCLGTLFGQKQLFNFLSYQRHYLQPILVH